MLVLCVAQAQNFEAKLITGFTASQVDGDGYGGYNQPGGVFGGATNFYLSDEVSFQQEICYYGRGSRKGAKGAGTDAFSVLGLHYMDINGVLNVDIDKLIVNGGLGYGILIYERTDAATGGLSVYRPDKFIFAGVGYRLNDNIIGMARMQYSLLTFHKYIFPYHHNTINFSLRFKIGGN